MATTFAAAKTTGIYCRPGCGANPKPGNVVRFPLAATAEAAGYRACLRCRPYRWPMPAGGIGPELVCRAVRLIIAGALDDRSEADLAASLAVSARHLRRLFAEHIGVTPDGLARSARTHLARQLLDDSDLPVADIAFAVGFGSVRQLNRSCREIFRMTPTELRARRRKTDRLVADGGLSLRLPYTGPLDGDAMLAAWAADAIPGVDAVADGQYRRVIVVGDQAGVLELGRVERGERSERATGGIHHLLLRLHLPHWGELVHLTAQARRLAGLDVDVDAEVNAGRPAALRRPGCWDPFEAAVRVVVERHSAPGTASETVAALAAMAGTPVAGLAKWGLDHAFPSPAQLMAAPLEAAGISTSGAAAIAAFACAVDSGALPLDGSLRLDRLLERLTRVGGIDEDSARLIAWRMGETDAFPPYPDPATAGSRGDHAAPAYH